MADVVEAMLAPVLAVPVLVSLHQATNLNQHVKLDIQQHNTSTFKVNYNLDVLGIDTRTNDTCTF